MKCSDCLSLSNGNMRLITSEADDRSLYIVFGCLNAAPGRYTFYRTFMDLKKNALFINSPKNDWFTNPISWLNGESLTASIDAFVDMANQLCKDHHLYRVVLVGFSMGAYGAMLYSSHGGFDHPVEVVAFGTETKLNLPKSISAKYKNLIPDLDSAGDLMNGGVFKPIHRYHMIFGELDIVDTYSALRLKEKFPDADITVSSHGGSLHNVVDTLKKTVGLELGMRKSLGFVFDVPGEGELANYLSSSDIEPLLNFSVTMNNESEIQYLKSLVGKYPFFVLALNRIGAYYHNRGDRKRSLEYLVQAWLIAPQYENTNTHLSLIYEKDGQVEQALSHAIMAKKQIESPNNLSRVEVLIKRLAAHEVTAK